MDELLVSVEEAARRLGVGRSAMYELLASGQVARVKIGRRTLVPVQELRAWVDRNVLAVGLAVNTSR
jgi:excisionase family DNA binding protein